jgi:ribosome-associated translation inhibitor RaiA
LSFALGARNDQIQRVVVRLTDINGPRGGKDICCHLQVSLAKQADVVIKDVEEDLYMAVDRAAGRVSRAVARQLARRSRRHRGQTPHKKVANPMMTPLGGLFQ